MRLLCLVLVSSAAFAGPIFQDNKGYLYCEMICRSSGTEHREGMYVTNHANEYSKVSGQWEKNDILGLSGATYHVKPNVYKAIDSKCLEKRDSLSRMPKIRGLLADSEFSGVSEKSCRVFPRITTGTGARLYEAKSVVEEETEF